MPVPSDPKIIANQLCQFVRTNLVADGVKFDADSALADFGIDSFALVELLLFSERTFGVPVPESQLTRENLASLSALARCIAGLARAGAPASPVPN
jgi:acyl carrier protein